MNKILKYLIILLIPILCIGTVNAIESGNAHISESLNGGDQDFSYAIDANIAGSPNWVRFDEGSGNVDKNIDLPYTFTKLTIYSTGKTSYFGDKAWWTNQRAEINFPDTIVHNVDIKISSDYKRCNWNKPYIKINGVSGAFDQGANGYGWYHDISWW
ncbi:MAG: hypothetical protein LBT10_01100 [Methanobrevibacter sp.]|nr:hypothetical protein [Methanobrevibacter sp.]